MLERLEVFVEQIVIDWYVGASGVKSATRNSPLLAHDSFVLEIEDLCRALFHVVELKEVQEMPTLSQIIQTAVQRLDRKGGAAPVDFSFVQVAKPRTVFGLEFCGQLKPTDALLDPGVRIFFSFFFLILLV